MNTKIVAGNGVNGGMVKRVAVAMGALAAFVAAAASVVMMWPSSPGPAVVVAVSTVVTAAIYLRARSISATCTGLVHDSCDEACNWYMDEEHMFMNGEPFSLATATQHS